MMQPTHHNVTPQETVRHSDNASYVKMLVIFSLAGPPLGSAVVFGLMGALAFPRMLMAVMIYGLFFGIIPAAITGVLGWLLRVRREPASIVLMTICGGMISFIWGEVITDTSLHHLIVPILVLATAILLYCLLFRKTKEIIISATVAVVMAAAAAYFETWTINSEFLDPTKTFGMFGACGACASLLLSLFFLPPVPKVEASDNQQAAD